LGRSATVPILVKDSLCFYIVQLKSEVKMSRRHVSLWVLTMGTGIHHHQWRRGKGIGEGTVGDCPQTLVCLKMFLLGNFFILKIENVGLKIPNFGGI